MGGSRISSGMHKVKQYVPASLVSAERVGVGLQWVGALSSTQLCWTVVYVVVLLSFVKNEERKVFTITVDLWMRTGEHGADGV